MRNSQRSMLLVAAGLLANVAGSNSTASAATVLDVQGNSFESPTLVNGNWGNLDAAWTRVGGAKSAIAYEENKNEHKAPHEGLWSVLLSNTGNTQVVNGQTVNYPPTIYQDLGSVTAGDTLSVTFYVGRAKSNQPATNVGGTGVATFSVGGTDYTQGFDTTTFAYDEWRPITLSPTIVNGGNLRLSFTNSTGFIWLDSVSDVTVTPVPEPAALGLLGVASLATLARRGRRSA